MNLDNATVLVTGANRGLGREFAKQALELGAAKVYATARRPESIDLPGATPLRLDVTDDDQVAEAARVAGDVTVIVNNAGISTMQDLVGGDLEQIRAEIATHLFGTLAVVRAFAPVLKANGGGAILNVMSALSFQVFPGAGAYSVAKAAEAALTDSIRLELAGQGTQVSGVFLAATDTDMMAWADVPKNDPVDVIRAAWDGVAAGELEIIIDEDTRAAKAGLSLPTRERYSAFLG